MKAQVRPIFLIFNVIIWILSLIGFILYTYGIFKFDNFAPVFISILAYSMLFFGISHSTIVLNNRISKIRIIEDSIEFRNQLTGKLKYKIDFDSDVEIKFSHIRRAFYPELILIYKNGKQVSRIEEIYYRNYKSMKETLGKNRIIEFKKFDYWEQFSTRINKHKVK